MVAGVGAGRFGIAGQGSDEDGSRRDRRDGDPALDATFEGFVVARGAALVWLARGLLRDPHHAEDVVQEVLAKAHQRWASITRAGNPEPYVRKMIVNESVSFWRRACRREISFSQEELPAQVICDGTRTRAERDLLIQLLRRLPPRQRAVLVLRHFQDLPDEEIAAALDCSPATVRSQAHRGMAKLRELLQAATSAQGVR